MPELSQIEYRRKLLELTQKQLAKKTNISQSLIAKIESGKVKPNYGFAKRLFDTLTRLESEKMREKEKTAKEIMTKNIVSCTTSQTLSTVGGTMVKNSISQIPVFDNGRIVGSISERTLISAQINHDAKEASILPLSKIMEPTFPIVDIATTRSVLYSLLRHCQAVLVVNKGKIVGIVSRADLLR
ncbi:MAG: CBS domain-containing protein [Candidatus Bathyarchaeota archaeon]